MVWFLAATLAAASPAMLVTGDACPGEVDVAVTGLTPGGQVAFLTGASVGSDPLPMGFCDGMISGLAGPGLVFVTTDADGDGALSFRPSLPESACDRQVVVVDRTSCTASAPVSLTPLPESVWLADTPVDGWAASGGDIPVEFVNYVFYADPEDSSHPCGDPLDPPVLSHVLYEGDTGVVRSWSTGDPDFDQLAACFTDGQMSYFWFRNQVNYVGGPGEGSGYSQTEPWILHRWWDCDPDLGPACDLAGAEVRRIDLEVVSFEIDADSWRYDAFLSLHGTPP